VATPLQRDSFIGPLASGAWFARAYLKEDKQSVVSAEKVESPAGLWPRAWTKIPSRIARRFAEKIIQAFNSDPEARKFRTQPNVDGWVLPDEIRTSLHRESRPCPRARRLKR
jgi:hypothetical protein